MQKGSLRIRLDSSVKYLKTTIPAPKKERERDREDKQRHRQTEK